jgi:hypothetical protein
MALFGSKKNREKNEEEGKTIEMCRIAFRMGGSSIEEARAFEKKEFGITFEDLIAIGHHCDIILQSPDGVLWMAYGKLEGKAAKEVLNHDSKLKLVERILEGKGIKDKRALGVLLGEALHSGRIRFYLPHATNPYKLSKYGSCLGKTLEDGKRSWLIDESLFGGKRKEELLSAILWCALKENEVPDPLAETYLEMKLHDTS